MTPGVKRTTKPRLNMRRKKFIRNLTDGLGVGRSALRAGYASRTEGTALLREPSVLTALQTAMDKAGITNKYKASKLKEGMEATYPQKRAKDGAVLQDVAPDYFTRGMYLDKALKVGGDYAPDRHVHENKTLTINVNIETMRGLVDCGVIDAEIIKELDGVSDAGTNEGTNEPVGVLGEGDGGGGDQEDSQDAQAVREETERAG